MDGADGADERLPFPPSKKPRSEGSSKRRYQTRTACKPCQTRKQRCDGVRPTCESCFKRQEPCHYDTRDRDETRTQALQRENGELRSKVEAHEQLIRQQTDAIWNMRQAMLAGGSPQPAMPGASFSGEPHAFPSFSLPPWVLASASSPVHEGVSSPRSPESSTDSPVHRRILSPFASHTSLSVGEPLPDARLQQLDIRYWTDVPISNEAAARAISLYLVDDHPICGFLDADLFIADLLAQRPRFCSPLLVSAVLYWATHAYSIFDPNAQVDEFREEAHRRGAVRPLPVDATTVSAILFLYATSAGDGMTEVTDGYLAQLLELSQSLGWYGNPTQALRELDPAEADEMKASAHTAWAVFNFVTLTSFHTQRHMIKSPPRFSIPGDGGLIGLEERSRTPIYHRLPAEMGQTFTAACRFYLVANEISLAYVSGNEEFSRQDPSVDFAESLYHRLRQWTDAMPSAEDPSPQGIPHHDLVFRLWVHCRILDLFRPFHARPVYLSTPGHRERTTQDVHAASLDRVKRDIFAFKLHYACAGRLIWINTALMQAIDCILGDPAQADRRFWLQTLAHELARLSSVWPVHGMLLVDCLGRGVQEGLISAEEAEEMQRSSERNGGRAFGPA